jgi:uncharacterized protein (TIGR03437 family)
MTLRTFSVWFAASAVLLPLAPSAPAQPSYTFTKILDLSTPRPDGAGTFTITTITTPAFDGQWVVFRDNGSKDDGSLQAIWSFNTKDGTFHKLADLHTVQPGGTATFTELHLLDTAPAVRNGTVVFLGRTAVNGQLLEGLYSVPAAGGTVVKVADYTAADPSGGRFTLFDSAGQQIGGFGFDGSTVAFRGQGSLLSVGVYAANPDGSSLSLVADSLHPYTTAGSNVATFSAPVVASGSVVMAGVAGSDATTGYNGLYLGKAGNNGAVTELVNSKQQLPGGSNAAFHTRFDAPYLAFDGNLVAFHASDSSAPTSSPLYGLYWTDPASHAINKIADVNSTLPGLGKLKNIGDQGVAVSQGNVLFRASDTTSGYPGNSGLYLWNNGTAIRAVGTGDLLDGKPLQVVHDPGPGALSGTGFAFLMEFGQTNAFALYYATPAASTAISVSTASYALNGPLAPNSMASAFGQGLTDSQASSAPPLPTTLANVAVSVKDSAGTGRQAAMYYAGPTQINYVVPAGTALGAATVTVSKSGQTVATGTIQVAAVAPGLFAANGDGKGAAAGNAVRVPASGAQTFTYLATCGAAAGSCVTAPIDLAASTDPIYLELYGTGIRGYKTGIAATIGGLAIPNPAFGVQSQYPGMDQVNLLLDRSLIGRGEVDVVLTVDGVAANTVKINVR